MDNLKIFSGSELNIMFKENIILAVSHETFKNVHKKPQRRHGKVLLSLHSNRFLINDFCDFDVQFNPTSVEAVTNNLAEIYLFEVL